MNGSLYKMSASQSKNTEQAETNTTVACKMVCIQDEEGLSSTNSEIAPCLPCLGYFENNQNADDACALVVSYEFKKDAKMRRDGNEKDLENLRKSFEEKRKCRYRELASPTAEVFLGVLQNEEELLKLFNISTVPSAFFLIILSHGEKNNIILTDHKDQDGKYTSFLTTQVVEAITMSPNLRVQLNVIFFGPCRGNLEDVAHDLRVNRDEYENQASSRLTNMPDAENFIIVYSTVETTSSIRDTSKGTWLVQGICNLLDNLDKDELLEVFITKLQHSIHDKLIGVGQTPEVKYTRHRKFVIRKATKPEVVSKTQSDGKGVNLENIITADRSAFFPWRTEDGTDLREKWAMIISNIKDDSIVLRTQEALQENLGFKTSIMDQLDSFFETTQGEQRNVGCFLAVFFAPLSLDKETNEICVRVGKTSVKIGDLVYKFLGPGNKMWIGRPKLFFFVHQTIDSYNISTADNKKINLTATNHSGSFICILKSEDSAEKLIHLLENPQLKNGTPIQELAADLLSKNTNNSDDVINNLIMSTLPFLVDVPVRPSTFVAPALSVISNNISKIDEETENHNEVRGSSSAMGKNRSNSLERQEPNEKNLTFDELKYEMKRQLLGPGKQEYCVWLFSSLPGSGKSTILREITSYLNSEKSEKIVFTVELQQLYDYLSGGPEINIVDVLSRADQINHDLPRIVKEKRAIVFLDGFDEICPIYQKQVMKLIKTCTQMQMPLVIATRPEEEQTILKSLEGLSTRIVEIKPLERKEQLELLLKLGKTEEECKELFELFEKSGTSEILTNPFHLTLTCDTKVESIGEIFGIYEQVIEKKVKKALETQKEITKPAKNKIDERVKLLMDEALRFLVNNESLSELAHTDIGLINNTGVASILEKKTRFVHKTFAEFLVALRFIQEIERESTSTIPIFKNVKLRQCRVFIDIYISRKNNFMGNLKKSFNQSRDLAIHRILGERHDNILRELEPQLTTLLNGEVNKRDENEETLLLLAARFSNAEMCRFLVENGADWSVVNNNGNDSLYLACLYGKLDNAKYLLGFNGFSVEKKGYLGRTALHRAAEMGHVEVAEFLLSKEANVNARDDKNNTPLTLAARFSSKEMCRFLVENGADLSAMVDDGDYALHLACIGGKLDNAKYFLGLNGFSVEKKGYLGRTALHRAAANGHVAVAEFLLSKEANVNARDDKNNTPLTLAARFSSKEMCRFLVENGADLSAVDKDGDDALHLASLGGKLENAKYLLGLNGFSVEKKGYLGREALHGATEKGHVAVAEFLLSKGANVNARDDDRNDTPLTLAAQFSSEEMCRFLVEKNADLSAVDKDGDDALHLACLRGKLENVKYLLELNGFSLEKKGMNGRTALHWTSVKSHVEVAKFLLLKGANVKARDDKNNTPLNLAAEFSSDEMCQFLFKYSKLPLCNVIQSQSQFRTLMRK